MTDLIAQAEAIAVEVKFMRETAAALDAANLREGAAAVRNTAIAIERHAAELRAQAAQPPAAQPVASAPHAEYDWMPEARQFAAQCWCDPETSQTQMDVVLAEAVARRIAGWMQTGAFHARNEEYWRDRALNAERQPDPRIAELEGLLQQLHDWDMMDVAADGKYWRGRIEAAIKENNT